jgi:hypothetical protein
MSRFGTPVTNFPINHELLVRFHFNIPASADLATYDDLLTVIVDNGLRGAYVNGHSISFSIERGGCDGVSTEFRVDLPNSRFVHGDNVIALHGYDLGGQSFFNMQYRDSFVPISEPPVQPDCTVVSYPSQQPASAVASTEVGAYCGAAQRGAAFAHSPRGRATACRSCALESAAPPPGRDSRSPAHTPLFKRRARRALKPAQGEGWGARSPRRVSNSRQLRVYRCALSQVSLVSGAP